MLKGLNCTRKQGMRLIPWHGFDDFDASLHVIFMLILFTRV